MTLPANTSVTPDDPPVHDPRLTVRSRAIVCPVGCPMA